MIISKTIPKEMIEMVLPIFLASTTKQLGVYTPVAFKMSINNTTLTPVGGHDGSEFFDLFLDDMKSQELRYEDMAYILINSDIVLFNEEISSEVTRNVIEYREVRVEIPDGNSIYIPSTKDMASREVKMHLNCDIKNAVVNIIFAKRDEFNLLEADFDNFYPIQLGNDTYYSLAKPITRLVQIEVETPSKDSIRSPYILKFSAYDDRILRNYIESVESLGKSIFNLQG